MSGLFSISPPVQALLATLLTWGVTALGAAMVIFARHTHPTVMDSMLGFGAGVMLASSFWSLLDPAVATAQELGQIPWLTACSGFLSGGLMLMLGDRLLSRLMKAEQHQRRAWLLMTSITLHNIPEGLAIGVAFGVLAAQPSQAALTGAWMLAVGIALQNFPEGAAVSLPLRREGVGRFRAWWMGQLSGVVEPVAAVAGSLLALFVRPSLPFLLAFAAGAMVAVVVVELVPESQRNPRRMLVTLATMLGFTVMMALDVGLG